MISVWQFIYLFFLQYQIIHDIEIFYLKSVSNLKHSTPYVYFWSGSNANGNTGNSELCIINYYIYKNLVQNMFKRFKITEEIIKMLFRTLPYSITEVSTFFLCAHI